MAGPKKNFHEDLSRGREFKIASNRSFGIVFVVVLSVIGIWPVLGGEVPRWWALGAAVALLVITLARPNLLALPNRAWSRLGWLLNRIAHPIIMGVIFYLVFTPMGLFMRALGKDPLRLRFDKTTDSYWLSREPPGPAPDSLNRQF